VPDSSLGLLPGWCLSTCASADTLPGLSVALFWAGPVIERLAFMPLTRRFFPARLLLICTAILALFSVALALALGDRGAHAGRRSRLGSLGHLYGLIAR
jgi:O-antigen ligase